MSGIEHVSKECGCKFERIARFKKRQLRKRGLMGLFMSASYSGLIRTAANEINADQETNSNAIDELKRSAANWEVAQFGWESTGKRLEGLGCKPIFRMTDNEKAFLTDGGNYIFDCAFGPIRSVQDLQSRLDATVGVVEHGLFVGIASRVVVGKTGGIQVLERLHGHSNL